MHTIKLRQTTENNQGPRTSKSDAQKMSVKMGPNQASTQDKLGVRRRWLNILWYIVLSEFTWLMLYHVTQHPNHALIFTPFVLKYLHLSIFIFQQPCGPHTVWFIDYVCLPLFLSLFEVVPGHVCEVCQTLATSDCSPFWHLTNSHQSGHMTTEQYVTPFTPKRPVLKALTCATSSSPKLSTPVLSTPCYANPLSTGWWNIHFCSYHSEM